MCIHTGRLSQIQLFRSNTLNSHTLTQLKQFTKPRNKHKLYIYFRKLKTAFRKRFLTVLFCLFMYDTVVVYLFWWRSRTSRRAQFTRAVTKHRYAEWRIVQGYQSPHETRLLDALYLTLRSKCIQMHIHISPLKIFDEKQ